MNLLLRFFGTICAVLLAAYVVPGFVVQGFYAAAIVAVILGIVNVTIKPIVKILTLPLTILTLGLFTFVINALLLMFIASFVEGFNIEGFIPAVLGGAVIAVVTWALDKLT